MPKRKDAAGKLSARQQAFVDAWLGLPPEQRQAKRAAEIAGYKNPSQRGYYLLRLGKVRDAIAAVESKTLEKLEITHEMIIEGVFAVASQPVSDPKPADILKAWEILAKMSGLWTDRTEVTHSGSIELKAAADEARAKLEAAAARFRVIEGTKE